MMQGEEWIIEGFGCSPPRLRNAPLLREFCERIARELELQVAGDPQWRTFPPPGGVTGLYLLSESHLACHTWPEHGTVSFNLFTCRNRARWIWEEALAETLDAQRVIVRRIQRDVIPSGTLNGKSSRREAAQPLSAAPNVSTAIPIEARTDGLRLATGNGGANS